MHRNQLRRLHAAPQFADAVVSATVRAHCAAADLGARLAPPDLRSGERQPPRRVQLGDDTGAQAAEYAMMSGVGVAIAAASVAVIRRTDVIKTVVTALVEVLVAFIQSWFGG